MGFQLSASAQPWPGQALGDKGELSPLNFKKKMEGREKEQTSSGASRGRWKLSLSRRGCRIWGRGVGRETLENMSKSPRTLPTAARSAEAWEPGTQWASPSLEPTLLSSRVWHQQEAEIGSPSRGQAQALGSDLQASKPLRLNICCCGSTLKSSSYRDGAVLW